VEHLSESSKTLSLDTDYEIKILAYISTVNPNQSSYIGAYVNGELFASVRGETNKGSDFRTYFPDALYVGKITDAVRDMNAEFTVDDIWTHKRNVIRHNGLGLNAAGDLFITPRFSVLHGHDADADGIQVLKSTVDPPVFSLNTVINRASPEDDRCIGGWYLHTNDDIYIFNTARNDDRVGGLTWRTYTNKSTDAGDSFAELGSGGDMDDYRFIPSEIFEGGDVFGASYLIDIGNNPANLVKFTKYNIAANTFTHINTLGAYEAIEANAYGNEVVLYDRPSDGKLVAIIRWDGGANSAFQTYRVSDDRGVTWGAHNSLLTAWGHKSGSISARIIGDELWVIGRSAHTSTEGRRGGPDAVLNFGCNWIAVCDPDTLEIISEFRWAYTTFGGDTANGDFGNVTDAGGGDWTVDCVMNAGSTGFFRVTRASEDVSVGSPWYYYAQQQ